jgi:hypothetical protein
MTERPAPKKKAVKTAQCAEQREANIGNIRERCDNAVRRLSSTFVQGIFGTGH